MRSTRTRSRPKLAKVSGQVIAGLPEPSDQAGLNTRSRSGHLQPRRSAAAFLSRWKHLEPLWRSVWPSMEALIGRCRRSRSLGSAALPPWACRSISTRRTRRARVPTRRLARPFLLKSVSPGRSWLGFCGVSAGLSGTCTQRVGDPFLGINESCRCGFREDVCY